MINNKPYPGCGVHLEWVDDFRVITDFTDEAFLTTQTTAVDVSTGELDHLLQTGRQLTGGNLEQVLDNVKKAI